MFFSEEVTPSSARSSAPAFWFFIREDACGIVTVLYPLHFALHAGILLKRFDTRQTFRVYGMRCSADSTYKQANSIPGLLILPYHNCVHTVP